MTERRGNWQPSAAQISLCLDCAAAKMPLEKAAALLNIGPRSLWIFTRRLGLPIFEIWRDRPRHKPVPAASGGSRAAESPAPPKTPARCPVPRLPAMVGHLRDFRTRA
jgi:hypothetical protein